MEPGPADGAETDVGGSEPTGDPTIRIVWGTATGPTALAAYDAALADAGVENYNLVTVSSVVPAGATVAPVGTAPDLGPAGNRLTVVQARVTVAAADLADGPDVDGEHGSAGLAWATGPGPGLFYEVAGAFDEAECRRRLEVGLEAGRGLRDWTFADAGERVVSVAAPTEGFAAAVVLGAYGESEPIF